MRADGHQLARYEGRDDGEDVASRGNGAAATGGPVRVQRLDFLSDAPGSLEGVGTRGDEDPRTRRVVVPAFPLASVLYISSRGCVVGFALQSAI